MANLKDYTVEDNTKCNKEVRCYDYMVRKCVRQKDHDLGCNPFSENYIDPRIKEKDGK